MSQRQRKANYWQDAPMPREQLVLIPTALEEMIPSDHPVRLIDGILDGLDWKNWEAAYNGSRGQPPSHPSVLAKTLLFALIRRIRSSRRIEGGFRRSRVQREPPNLSGGVGLVRPPASRWKGGSDPGAACSDLESERPGCDWLV